MPRNRPEPLTGVQFTTFYAEVSLSNQLPPGSGNYQVTWMSWVILLWSTNYQWILDDITCCKTCRNQSQAERDACNNIAKLYI